MGERTRGTVWCVRALLFAALLVGIVSMHTLGHPSPEPASAPAVQAPAAAPVAAQHADAGQQGVAGQHADAGQQANAGLHAEAAAHVMPTDGSSSHSDHGMGMDPMSVCLAVLGVWSAAALLGAAVVLALRARPRDLLAPRRARILRALRPLPPPSTSTRLAKLSVLRV